MKEAGEVEKMTNSEKALQMHENSGKIEATARPLNSARILPLPGVYWCKTCKAIAEDPEDAIHDKSNTIAVVSDGKRKVRFWTRQYRRPGRVPVMEAVLLGGGVMRFRLLIPRIPKRSFRL